MENPDFTFFNTEPASATLKIPLSRGHGKTIAFTLSEQNGVPTLEFPLRQLTISAGKTEMIVTRPNKGQEQIPLTNVRTGWGTTHFTVAFSEISRAVFTDGKFYTQNERSYDLQPLQSDSVKLRCFHEYKNIDGSTLITPNRLPIGWTDFSHINLDYTGRSANFSSSSEFYVLSENSLLLQLGNEATITASADKVEIEYIELKTKMRLTTTGLQINRAGQVRDVTNDGLISNMNGVRMIGNNSPQILNFTYELETGDILARFAASPFQVAETPEYRAAARMNC